MKWVKRLLGLWRDEQAPAMVEYALVFPLQLFFLFGLFQVALIGVAGMMTDYAVFSAARASLLGPHTESDVSATESMGKNSASFIGTAIPYTDAGVGDAAPGPPAGFMLDDLPYRGNRGKIGFAYRLLSNGRILEAAMYQDVELIVPIAGEVLGGGKSFLFMGGGEPDSSAPRYNDRPHTRVTRRVRLWRPWAAREFR